MKKLVALGIAAIMMTACQKDDENTETTQYYSVTATMPQIADTRLSYEEIGRDLKVRWQEQDKVKVGNKESIGLSQDRITEDGTVATLIFSTPPVGTEASFGKHDNTVKQILGKKDPLRYMTRYHAMAGTYDSETRRVKLKHTTSIMRIALSGLPKNEWLDTFTLSDNNSTYYTGNAVNLVTTAEGEIVIWLVVDPQILNTKTELTFSITTFYNSREMKYTEYFPQGVNIEPGKVLHCTIKMPEETPDA